MAVESKQKKIYYKLVRIPECPFTLQELLEDVLTKEDSLYRYAIDRRQSLVEDGKSFLFINRHGKHGGTMLMCQMVLFEEGRSQMTIVVDSHADMFEVNPVSANDLNLQNTTSGEERGTTEFLESMLYFGVLGNHMVMMGSKSLGSKDLERHLGWLLHSLTKKIKNVTVYLNDSPAAETIKALEKTPAKSVQVGSDVVYEQNVEPPKTENYERQVTETKSIRWTPSGMGANVLEYLSSMGYIGKINLEDSLDESNLKVKIEFTFDRKTTKSGQRVIDNLATSMRHFDEEDVKITLKGGGEIKGDQIKLSHKISVKFRNGKIDEFDLYYKIVDWLKTKILTSGVTSDLTDIVINEE